jgi:predicted RNA-binding protein with PUA-like domain
MLRASMPGYFLVKSEPDAYSFDDLKRDKQTRWDGVRNFSARNNLRTMKAGDLVLFYHSGEGKEVVGIARVMRGAYADPSAKGEDWSAVDIEPVRDLDEPVPLATMKADPALADMVFLKQPRLSVAELSAVHFKRILTLGKTKL